MNRLMNRDVLLIPLALGFALLAGCDTVSPGNFCTEIACDDFTHVVLQAPAGSSFPPGFYHFVVYPQGGYTMDIDCRLEAGEIEKICDASNWPQFWVAFEGGQWTFSMPAIWVGDPTLEAPELLSLSVTLDGSLILDQDLSPDYDAFYPNGELCDDSLCYQATHTLEASAL